MASNKKDHILGDKVRSDSRSGSVSTGQQDATQGGDSYGSWVRSEGHKTQSGATGPSVRSGSDGRV